MQHVGIPVSAQTLARLLLGCIYHHLAEEVRYHIPKKNIWEPTLQFLDPRLSSTFETYVVNLCNSSEVLPKNKILGTANMMETLEAWTFQEESNYTSGLVD